MMTQLNFTQEISNEILKLNDAGCRTMDDINQRLMSIHNRWKNHAQSLFVALKENHERMNHSESVLNLYCDSDEMRLECETRINQIQSVLDQDMILSHQWIEIEQNIKTIFSLNDQRYHQAKDAIDKLSIISQLQKDLTDHQKKLEEIDYISRMWMYSRLHACFRQPSKISLMDIKSLKNDFDILLAHDDQK